MTKRFSLLFLLLCGMQAYSVPLSGTFTIGGTNPDYTTISQAITALDSNGINGPVVFNIRDGVYPELLYFNPVCGASFTNTITFQGESGDSSLVEINGATTSVRQNTVFLNEISYFTLKHVTLRQYPNVQNNAVLFVKRGKYCTLSHCYLLGYQSGTSSATEYVIQGCNDSGMVVSHNRLQGSSSGNYFGNPYFSHRNLVIENNVMFAGRNDIFLDKGALAIIRGNTTGGRVVLQQSSRAQIYGNYISNMLQLISSDGWAQQPMLIYNNIITGGSYNGSVGYSFWANSSTHFNFYNNTVYMNSPTFTGYAMYLSDYGSGVVNIKNNIIYREDTSSANYLFRYANAESYIGSIFSDYNLFYRNGTSITNNYNDLAAFTAGTGLDSHSVYANPVFASPSYLYPTSDSASNLAQPVSYITTDYEGNIRNPYSPTAGAYEMQSAPMAINALQSASFCPNQLTSLQANFSGTVPFSFQWVKNGITLANDTLQFLPIPQAQLSDTGTYLCIATNSLGTDTLTFQVDLNAVLNSGVSQSSDTLVATLPQANYQWFDCTNLSLLAADTNQTFVAPANGSYGLIISQNGCTDTSACYPVLVTGFESHNPNLLNNFAIYPNPAQDRLTVNYTGENANQTPIIVTDVLGKEVYRASSTTQGSTCLDIQYLPKGVYVVKMGLEQLKFIKE